MSTTQRTSLESATGVTADNVRTLCSSSQRGLASATTNPVACTDTGVQAAITLLNARARVPGRNLPTDYKDFLKLVNEAVRKEQHHEPLTHEEKVARDFGVLIGTRLVAVAEAYNQFFEKQMPHINFARHISPDSKDAPSAVRQMVHAADKYAEGAVQAAPLVDRLSANPLVKEADSQVKKHVHPNQRGRAKKTDASAPKRPRGPKKKPGPPKKKSQPVRDDEEDDFTAVADGEESPKKRKKKPQRVRAESDDEDSAPEGKAAPVPAPVEEEEEEEETPPPSAKKDAEAKSTNGREETEDEESDWE